MSSELYIVRDSKALGLTTSGELRYVGLGPYLKSLPTGAPISTVDGDGYFGGSNFQYRSGAVPRPPGWMSFSFSGAPLFRLFFSAYKLMLWQAGQSHCGAVDRFPVPHQTHPSVFRSTMGPTKTLLCRVPCHTGRLSGTRHLAWRKRTTRSTSQTSLTSRAWILWSSLQMKLLL